MATIRDVAKAAGVSIASVSAVLNKSGRVGPEATERIWAAVEAVGYSPNPIARSLRRGHSALVGMIVGDITNPFSAELVRVVEHRVRSKGFSVIVGNLDSDASRLPVLAEQMRNQMVAGILVAPTGHGPEVAEVLAAQPSPPVVTYDQRVPGLDCDFVGVDNREAMRLLVDYLARMGHRRIGLVSGDGGNWTSDERMAGFLNAIDGAGLEADPALCVRASYHGRASYDAALTLMTRADRPTAVVGANNVISLCVLQACLDLGFRCPQDVSIVGVDDVPWSGLVRPNLTIAAQPLNEIAERAIDWLIERVENPDAAIPPREHIVMPTLRIGESCQPLLRDTSQGSAVA
ncbi:LacI family DNA-binding transcriptional regulator [uncultured Alsobacter sp.]|uniref:LacI family DNA-binding transcriptional regulator n=1 Tax=uncultured Alsobacter sp. TaxID=1748258 RepID=UPI0025CBFA7C|nr:LacI family DNA-binding transcriptional regulator [uncultured Alsobacter sp.]